MHGVPARPSMPAKRDQENTKQSNGEFVILIGVIIQTLYDLYMFHQKLPVQAIVQTAIEGLHLAVAFVTEIIECLPIGSMEALVLLNLLVSVAILNELLHT